MRKYALEKTQILVEELMTPLFCSRHHIESYNSFILNDIPSIISANKTVYSDIDQSFYLTYKSIRITKPSLEEDMNSRVIFPNECRIRDLTYSANLYADIEYIKDKIQVTKNNVFLGKIPVMLKSILCHLSEENKSFHKINIGNESYKLPLTKSHAEKDKIKYKSKECPNDYGGYFIINGVERVVLIQEQLSKNRIIVEHDKQFGRIVSVTSSTLARKSKTGIYLNKKSVLTLKNNIFTTDVPLIIVLKAFGMTTDKMIVEFIGYEQSIIDMLEISIEECCKEEIFTQTQALNYLNKSLKLIYDDSLQKIDKVQRTRKLLNDVILPNIPNEGANQFRKALILCFMTRFLLLDDKVDDIDFVGNKRFEMSGQLLSLLFEDTFIRFNTDLKKSIDKVLSRIRSDNFDALSYLNLQVNLITNSFNRAISTGNWSLKRFRMDKKGVSQVLSRLSYTSAIGMMTRIQAQFEKTRKISGPRSLHTSSFGVICPNDTPEGESCGLVKNLSLLAYITTGNKKNLNNDLTLEIKDEEKDLSEEIILKMNIKHYSICNANDIHSGYSVFLNGSFLGVAFHFERFINELRNLRNKNILSPDTSISKSDSRKIINISTDSGRLCRPLLILKDNKTKLTFKDVEQVKNRYKSVEDLFKEGKIEYIDVNESNDSLISFFDPYKFTDICERKSDENIMGVQYTHMEVSDYTMLGYIASLIPFPNHNQSPRNTYQCAMSKQAMGILHSFYRERYDNVLNILTYAQKPIVSSRTKQFMPSGTNAMVAVMSYSGYDIEDALILNRASLDRGFAIGEIYKSYKQEIKEYIDGTKQKLVFKKFPGEKIVDGDYFINLSTNDPNKLTGERYKGLDPAVLDSLIITTSDVPIVKARIRQIRVPELGDKFSSRHGQKGVVGLIVEEINLPFNEKGIKPDIIMNPHGYPSRMTVGKILELIYGKIGALEGKEMDATIFSCDIENFGVEKLKDVQIDHSKNLDFDEVVNQYRETFNVLTKHGFSYSGKECFYSGITGEIMEGYVFFGPIYYQRLKHMVADKMHARAKGPRALLTRQPTEGRSKQGGLRLGEMERDCLVGYGVSHIILERLLTSSDGYEVNFCSKCCLIITKEKCCGSPISCIVPYAFKLLLFELLAMNIVPKIYLKKL